MKLNWAARTAFRRAFGRACLLAAIHLSHSLAWTAMLYWGITTAPTLQ